MTRYIVCLIGIFASAVVVAETIVVDATGHYARINEPAFVELEDDNEMYPGYRRHISVTNKDGTAESHWCFGSNVMDDDDLEFGGGFCTALDEDGDVYWTWFEVARRGGFDWIVMGGTGKYKGATGSGASRASGSLPDGSATFQIKGEIELADD